MSKHEHTKCELEKIIHKKRLKGFTLVELIVVITILAILGTIGFIAFQNYTKSARDGTRIADINMIKQNLGI
ncbi:MAG: prepilin-type N-terminal cleavage/methylation domain-containing protein, partial [Candidatus Gracilibacteria bacterium]